MHLYHELEQSMRALKFDFSEERKALLRAITARIQEQLDSGEKLNLNFICTHNSRRSQLAQAWAQAMAVYYDIPVVCFSGGSEKTAFHVNAQKALQQSGFIVETEDQADNPIVRVSFSPEVKGLKMYSKKYDEAGVDSFIALMTCSDADENCPYIPEASARIKFTFDDPKVFDNTDQAVSGYVERSLQIAAQLKFIFSNLHI